MRILFINKFGLLILGLGFITGMVLLFPSAQSWASGPIKPDECCRCHFDVCNQAQTKQYVHKPVEEHQCAACHLKENNPISKTAGRDNAPKVDWFCRRYTSEPQHWVELPKNSGGLPLAVEIRGINKQIIHQEIAIPTLADIQPVQRPQSDAAISDVQVVEVKRGVFISAKVSWETDRIATTRLRYGKKKLETVTAADSAWTTHHTMTISGLEHKKDYLVAAVSQDIFGNEIISQPIPFTTNHFFTKVEQNRYAPLGKISLQTGFFKENKRIFVSIKANQPISLKLGFLPGKAPHKQDDRTTLPTQHLELSDPHTLTIGVCLKCHPASKDKLSHPVDVQPAKGMVVPADYKRLADGRITCMTCHLPHASNNHYRLTRATRKDLCTGCHRNF
jgi:predicted CXXCH cytochrome family protein